MTQPLPTADTLNLVPGLDVELGATGIPGSDSVNFMSDIVSGVEVRMLNPHNHYNLRARICITLNGTRHFGFFLNLTIRPEPGTVNPPRVLPVSDAFVDVTVQNSRSDLPPEHPYKYPLVSETSFADRRERELVLKALEISVRYAPFFSWSLRHFGMDELADKYGAGAGGTLVISPKAQAQIDQAGGLE